MGTINRLLMQVICVLIRCYQYLISPMMKPCCRFHPSCSEYAIGAIRYYGLIIGMWMSLKRLLRCHPWSCGGNDPVLPNDEKL